MQSEIIRFAEFELDLGRYELRRGDGHPVKLEKIPMELLILLVEREGQLVSREEIIQRLWGGDVFVDTRQGINTAVRKIRLALRDDPDDPRVVQTVFGKGYRLVAAAQPVTAAVASAGAGVAAPAEPANPGKPAGDADGASLSTSVAPPPHHLMDPGWARALFLLIQAGYLAMYAAAFLNLPGILALGLPRFVAILTLFVGLVGAALRLYLISAVALNYPGSGPLFRAMFPGVLVLDAVWAASPLLLFHRLGEFALLGCAALAFLPFSQRTLISCAYPGARIETRAI